MIRFAHANFHSLFVWDWLSALKARETDEGINQNHPRSGRHRPGTMARAFQHMDSFKIGRLLASFRCFLALLPREDRYRQFDPNSDLCSGLIFASPIIRVRGSLPIPFRIRGIFLRFCLIISRGSGIRRSNPHVSGAHLPTSGIRGLKPSSFSPSVLPFWDAEFVDCLICK